MLEIEVPETELYDEESNTFITYDAVTLRLEHSLSSLSKWEMKWKKPFLSNLPEHQKTVEELYDYVRCMSLDPVDDSVINRISFTMFESIQKYIEDPMTATTINDGTNSKSKTFDTSEIIYYWMIEMGIPFECQDWPLNRLLMLIRVCSVKRSEANGTGSMSKRQVMERNRMLNEQRKAKMNTKG